MQVEGNTITDNKLAGVHIDAQGSRATGTISIPYVYALCVCLMSFLYVCRHNIYSYVYALYVCLISFLYVCRHNIYSLCVCLICMPYLFPVCPFVYALYACLISFLYVCRHNIDSLHVCLICMPYLFLVCMPYQYSFNACTSALTFLFFFTFFSLIFFFTYVCLFSTP